MSLYLNIVDDAIDELLKNTNFIMEKDINVTCKCSQDKKLKVYKKGNSATIEYGRRVELFRGLGLLLEHQKDEEYVEEQKAAFLTNGIMLDCSRNGVPKVTTVKKFIRIMALMGLDTLMLYTEDTYEIPEYPYFGYMRGRYSTQELNEIDDYACAFGVEVVPCIQTLAHLQGIFTWPCFEEVHDCTDILLCDNEKTYELIEAMIRACRNSLKSNRIHIGMDEAFFMGFGKYRYSKNPLEREEIFCKHIERVVEICKKYDFKPMIWSDMFFRIAFNNDYDSSKEIPEEFLEKLNKDVELVYWNYEALNVEDYIFPIEQHQKFPNEFMFAGGAWRWSGFAPDMRYSLKASYSALKACRRKNVDDILLTAWGDNGNEASFFDILTVMQLYAELNYHEDITKEEISRRFYTCTGESFDDMLLMDLPNYPENKVHRAAINPSKYLLYQDTIGGLLEKHVTSEYPAHYARIAGLLFDAADRSKEYGFMYRTLAELCSALEIKCIAGVNAQKCYLNNDIEGLNKIANKDLPELLTRLERFHKALEYQWNEENKVFGYEVLDLRLGGVESRVKTAMVRINGYINGTIPELEELKEERLYFDCRDNDEESKEMSYSLWMPVASANLI